MDNKTNTPAKTAKTTAKTVEVTHVPSQDALVVVRRDLMTSIMITSVLTNLAMFIAWLAHNVA
ncbi:MAG TPA: hypothetical protein PKD68_01320 [Candidatus Saccharibacteria bacterium]|nr:hypothetical protein [Candidatus Saccharibacteria bacterium]